MTLREEFKMYRDDHEKRVTNDTTEFMKWYDLAGNMVLEGKSKEDVIDELSPWGCDATQSNGVGAGACQASRLKRFFNKTLDKPEI